MRRPLQAPPPRPIASLPHTPPTYTLPRVPQPAQHAAEARPETPAADTADSFDISLDKHRGQYALRKLYHESDRVLAVLYTSPTCGPCRTLKPIFNGVMDEVDGVMRGREGVVEVLHGLPVCTSPLSPSHSAPTPNSQLAPLITLPNT